MSESAIKNISPEKPTTHNEKAQKIVLIFGGILVAALILSMFVGTGDHPSKSEQKNPTQAMHTQYDDANGFVDQVAFDKKQTKNLNADDEVLDQLHAERNRELEPESWQKQEAVRVLKSRTVGFGFEPKTFARVANKATA